MGAEDAAMWTGRESALCRERVDALHFLLGFATNPKGLDDLSAIYNVDRKTNALRVRYPSLNGVATTVGNRCHRHHGGSWQFSLFVQGPVWSYYGHLRIAVVEDVYPSERIRVHGLGKGKLHRTPTRPADCGNEGARGVEELDLVSLTYPVVAAVVAHDVAQRASVRQKACIVFSSERHYQVKVEARSTRLSSRTIEPAFPGKEGSGIRGFRAATNHRDQQPSGPSRR